MESGEGREEEKGRKKRREDEGFKRWIMGLILIGGLVQEGEEAAAAAISVRCCRCDGCRERARERERERERRRDSEIT